MAAAYTEPSPHLCGDGAWTAGGCQRSYVLSPMAQGPEIYLTGTDGGGMCPPPSSLTDDCSQK